MDKSLKAYIVGPIGSLMLIMEILMIMWWQVFLF